MNKTGIERLGMHREGDTLQLTVWAPAAKAVHCVLQHPEESFALRPGDYGYWHGEHPAAGRQELTYWLEVDGNTYPDPASRAQPQGVHGPSAWVDLAYAWTDGDYRAPAMADLIIYELHVGTFSDSHDFAGVIERIPHLLSLGINAIEIMPIAQFPGERNWGYDGVLPFAVQHSYGGAKGLQQLVDACHAAGIAVILDVVYNHVGPEGNYLPNFGPYFTDKYGTPWGQAINYDDAWSQGVRDYVLANVRMWFTDFHIDGLRLDAVHAIKDFSPSHLLQDLRRLTDAIMAERNSAHYLIVECDLNDRRYLDALDTRGFAMDAQWIDEFHHALRVAVGEEKKGYYKEFNGLAHLAKAYSDAYVFDGGYSEHRHKFFGTKATGLDGDRFIVFSQNHDQIGNRMLGERSGVLFSAAKQRLMAAAVLLSPFTPMLFMGEEWGSKRPFQYFVSHGDEELVEAVRNGRKQEFADFQAEGSPPDPQAKSTFANSMIDWQELHSPESSQMLHYYSALIKLRKDLADMHPARREQWQVRLLEQQTSLLLTLQDEGAQALCLLNFSAERQAYSLPQDEGWQLLLNSDAPQWGGQADADVTPLQGDRLWVAAHSAVLLKRSLA